VDVVEKYNAHGFLVTSWLLAAFDRRWGYRTLGAVADVVEKYKAADIPLEVIWTDIDYMVRTSNTMRYKSCYCCHFR
jgi:alpha-glucosidase (family GH31 glycosyl hydrolase)